MTPEQKAACKNCYCNSALGKMVTGGAGPMALMSGGLVPNCCAQNSLANDLKKSAESPEGAAAKVKADEADAKARAAAIRYLANVDCERWPEATETLKNALRKDRNECVRLEAALALRNGCCCNNETIDALKNCVLGENKTDPAPVERSDRVRAVAAEALARCCMVHPMEDPRERMQKTEAVPSADPADYYKKLATMPRDQVLAGARAALVSMQKPVKGQTTGQTDSNAVPGAVGIPPVSVTGTMGPSANNLTGILGNAFSPGGAQARQPYFSGLTRTLTGKQDMPASPRPEGESRGMPVRPTEPGLANPGAPPRMPSSMLLPPVSQSAAPTRDDVARMIKDGRYSPAEVAAVTIKVDEAQARSRQAAVKYLATVDWHYYPEAELSLIAALRADRSEAVRLEAAQVLGGCHGVTVRLLDALHMTATAQETDGNPAETSERVRAAARQSLNQLLSLGNPRGAVSLAPMPATPFVPSAGFNPPIPASMNAPASQQERDIAATVGVPAMAAAPARQPQNGFWTNFISGRDTTAAPSAVDPRLRGLTPIGSESIVGYPGAQPH